MSDEQGRKDLRRRAEKRVLQMERRMSQLTRGEALSLVHELRVHQVELEMQKEELQEAQGNLAGARDRYRDLFDFAPVGYLTLSKHTIIKEANITMCQMLGATREDLLRRRLTTFIAPESQDEFYRHRRQIFRTGEKQTCELVMRRSDGSSFWAMIDCILYSDGLRVTARDVSLLKKAEEDLRVKDYAVASTSTGIAMADLVGNLTYVNPALLKMWGYTEAKEVLGKPTSQFFTEGSRAQGAFKSALERGEWQGELEAVRRDGSVLHAYVSANLVNDFQGHPIKVMASFTDISERKKAERFKDDFLSMVSHEMKTPLTIMLGGLHTLASYTEELTPEEKHDLLLDTCTEADALADMVDNLLELSRHQAGRLKLTEEKVDLSGLLRHMVDRAKDQHPGYEFEVECGDLPEVRADRIRLERVIYNLLDNAAKYSPEGSNVWIFCGVRDGEVVVTVRDEGNGITAEEKGKLFTQFERLGHDSPKGPRGTGLGLVVSKNLVEAHGGRIWMESEPRKGSTLSFTIPL